MTNESDAPSAIGPHGHSWTSQDWILAIGLSGLCLLGLIACFALLPA